jgi:hypothetical protein
MELPSQVFSLLLDPKWTKATAVALFLVEIILNIGIVNFVPCKLPLLASLTLKTQKSTGEHTCKKSRAS